MNQFRLKGPVPLGNALSGERARLQLPIFGVQGKVSSLYLEKVAKTCRSGRPAPQLSDYPHQMTDNIRFADLDVQNHVNNVAIATYFRERQDLDLRATRCIGLSVPGAGSRAAPDRDRLSRRR